MCIKTFPGMPINMKKCVTYTTCLTLLDSIPVKALRDSVQVVDQLPFKSSELLVETDVSQILLIREDAPKPSTKVFKVLLNRLADMRTEAIVRNDTDELFMLETRGESANGIRKRLQLNRREYGIEDIYGACDAACVKSTEFIHEALLSMGLSRVLLDGAKTPHVTRSVGAYLNTSEDRGCLVMERIFCTLYDALKDRCGMKLETRAVAGMYLQTIHALAIAQIECNLKHHDLHTKNVFIKKLVPGTMWNGVDLSAAKYFKYTVGSHEFYVENCGYLPQLADFGLSSGAIDGVALERVDMGMLGGGSDGSPSEDWGEWTPDIAGRRGYDLQVLFSEDPVSNRTRLSRSAALAQLSKRLLYASNADNGTLSECGRPVVASDIPPEHVLLSVFSSPAHALYNFLNKPPADALTADMGALEPRAYTAASSSSKAAAPKRERSKSPSWSGEEERRRFSPCRKKRGKKGGAKKAAK